MPTRYFPFNHKLTFAIVEHEHGGIPHHGCVALYGDNPIMERCENHMILRCCRTYVEACDLIERCMDKVEDGAMTSASIRHALK